MRKEYYTKQKWPQIKKCKNCGKEFEIDYQQGSKLYCSKKCSSRYRYVNKKLKEWPQKRICLYCGKEFEIDYTQNKKIYCSKECFFKKKYEQYYYTKRKRIKKCKYCGEEFESVEGKIYCCAECLRKNRNLKKRQKNPLARKICLHCKEEFRTRSSVRKFCSHSCAKKYCSVNRPYRPSKKYLAQNYPSYICQNCGYKMKLNFHPISKEGKLFLDHMKCPKCHAH